MGEAGGEEAVAVEKVARAVRWYMEGSVPHVAWLDALALEHLADLDADQRTAPEVRPPARCGVQC